MAAETYNEKLIAAGSRVRHGLLQPTAAMNTLLSSLSSETPMAHREKVLSALRRGLGELDGTIRELCEFLSLTYSSARLEQEDVSIPEAIGKVISDATEDFGQSDLSVTQSVDDVTLRLDLSVFNLALKPVILNAMEFAKGQYVTVSTLTDDAFLRIFVTDGGEGFSETAAALALEPFYTTESACLLRPNRLGLGLATAQAAAIKLGGDLGVQAKQPDQPNTVVLAVPIKPS